MTSAYSIINSDPDLKEAFSNGECLIRIKARELPKCDVCLKPLRQKYRQCACGFQMHTRCAREHMRD